MYLLIHLNDRNFTTKLISYSSTGTSKIIIVILELMKVNNEQKNKKY